MTLVVEGGCADPETSHLRVALPFAETPTLLVNVMLTNESPDMSSTYDPLLDD